MGYGWDALGRLTSVTRPGGVYWQVNHGYGYDLLGRMVQASDSYGRSLTFGYDALSRRTSQGDNWYGPGNASYGYDLGGRRTRTTWWDGFFVTYEYDQAGALTIVRENGGLGLASYGYDDLGRRTSVARGNGTVTGYGYDAAGRLASLTQDLAGGAWDLTLLFGYNPASQIASRTSSNDTYAYTGAYNIDRPYASDGLNRYTSAGSTGFGYDGRGNLTQSGGTTYGYTVDNRLATAPGYGLAYDPLGRLFNGVPLLPGDPNTTLLYDGADVIAEINNDTHALLRRYVHGDGSDEPLVQYDAGGRRWLHADERGSVIALSDDAGNAVAINRYDEYGIPASTNQGRFQYTGQKWIAELGLYDYKARMYSPTLGRFMQTDPIGYADGMNWYNYVGGDPVNATDPSGLKCVINGATGPDYDEAGCKQMGGTWTADAPIVITASFGAGAASLSTSGGGISTGSLGGAGDNGGSGSPQNGDFHYKVDDFAFCSADSLFAQFSKPGNSAPGAPAAQPGTTPDIVLTGGNPITQIVDPGSRTITNVTQEGHRYYPGTVEIRINPTWYGSSVSIVGRGTTPRYWENSVLEKALFTALSTRATIACTVGAK